MPMPVRRTAKLAASVLAVVFYTAVQASAQLAAQAEAACVASNATLTPYGEEGPYYVDDFQLRQNITEGMAGIPFAMTYTVLDEDCNPVEGAFVDIWHCSGVGYYSAEEYATGGQSLDLLNTTFLRGVWQTNSSGEVTFYSIVPGWYSGRATHVHVKVHVPVVNSTTAAEFDTSLLTFLGQSFFNDSFLDSVYVNAPYTSDSMGTRTLTTQDHVWVGETGSSPDVFFAITNDTSTGSYTGTVTLVVSLEANITSATASGIGPTPSGGTSTGGPQLPGGNTTSSSNGGPPGNSTSGGAITNGGSAGNSTFGRATMIG